MTDTLKYIDLKFKMHEKSFHYIFFYFATFVFAGCLLTYATRVREVAEYTEGSSEIICNCDIMITFLSLVIIFGIVSFIYQFFFQSS